MSDRAAELREWAARNARTAEEAEVDAPDTTAANDPPATAESTPATHPMEGRRVEVAGVWHVVRDGALIPETSAPASEDRGPRREVESSPETLSAAEDSKPEASDADADAGPAAAPELNDARQRGVNNDGEKMYDVVLAMTEGERAEFSTWLAGRQRALGTRSLVQTLLRSLEGEA